MKKLQGECGHEWHPGELDVDDYLDWKANPNNFYPYKTC